MARHLLDDPHWLWRDHYNLPRTDQRYQDATDVDIYLDLFLVGEREARRARERGESPESVATSDVGTDAFDRLVEREAEEGAIPDEDFGDMLIAEARALLLRQQAGEIVTEEDRALDALAGFLGDAYRESDYRKREG